MNRILQILILLSLLSAPLYAQSTPTPGPLQVVPWNGHKAATSLTFDDGDPAHLDVVIPELNKRGMHGTFFLIANKTDRKDEWRQALKAGHEIGNHTLDHLHVGELSESQMNSQVVGAQNVLQKEFGITLYSFAYPFSEVKGLKDWVEKTSFIARSGGDAMNYAWDKNLDWWSISSKTTMSNYPFETYQGWVDECMGGGAWLVWMIHGVEGTPWGWQPIPLATFKKTLDYLQTKDIWVGTFTEVGAYLRAWKAFEASTIKMNGSEKVYSWVVPDHCPDPVTFKLKAVPGAPGFELWQKGEKIIPNQGIYQVSFNAGTLSLRY